MAAIQGGSEGNHEARIAPRDFFGIAQDRLFCELLTRPRILVSLNQAGVSDSAKGL
jgi:hypothetical protein